MLAGVSPFSSRPARRPLLLLLWALLAAPWAAAAEGARSLEQPPSDPPRRDPLAPLTQACQAAQAAGDGAALRQVQQQLLQRPSQPEALGLLLARAEALLGCKAPAGALEVLDRGRPGPGSERQLWLLLRWQAAQAGLDHRLAADSLWRLAAGDLASLEPLALPVSPTAQRSALDVLADHVEALGWHQRAAEVLLSGRHAGAQGAARLGRAVTLAQALPLAERRQLLERALEQAAQAGAWGLVAQLLDQQLALEEGTAPDALAVQRRLRLSPRIDDAYGEWRLRPRPELEQHLRSPRQPGGHAATSPSSAQP